MTDRLYPQNNAISPKIQEQYDKLDFFMRLKGASLNSSAGELALLQKAATEAAQDSNKQGAFRALDALQSAKAINSMQKTAQIVSTSPVSDVGPHDLWADKFKGTSFYNQALQINLIEKESQIFHAQRGEEEEAKRKARWQEEEVSRHEEDRIKYRIEQEKLKLEAELVKAKVQEAVAGTEVTPLQYDPTIEKQARQLKYKQAIKSRSKIAQKLGLKKTAAGVLPKTTKVPIMITTGLAGAASAIRQTYAPNDAKSKMEKMFSDMKKGKPSEKIEQIADSGLAISKKMKEMPVVSGLIGGVAGTALGAPIAKLLTKDAPVRPGFLDNLKQFGSTKNAAPRYMKEILHLTKPVSGRGMPAVVAAEELGPMNARRSKMRAAVLEKLKQVHASPGPRKHFGPDAEVKDAYSLAYKELR